eukprot:COSAG06_NODE_474_length_15284_cov_124.295582_4_plen_47_part_00
MGRFCMGFSCLALELSLEGPPDPLADGPPPPPPMVRRAGHMVSIAS